MSDYRVNLDIFAGPLDLLLYLVRKEEVDIYDIPIARITEQYIAYLEVLKQLDIDLVGDFLIMAATLMEIKSAMLLPQATQEESAEGEETGDPRAELVRQLLEYKRYKDAANFLEESAERQQMRFNRPDSILHRLEPEREPELDLDQVSIWTLLEAFDAILKATGFTSPYNHIKDETPIDLYQIEILHRLQTEGPLTFERVFEKQDNRLVMIGMFLAMLELIRNKLIWAEQTEDRGTIHLKPLTAEPAEEAVRNALYREESTAMDRPHPMEPAPAAEAFTAEDDPTDAEAYEDEEELVWDDAQAEASEAESAAPPRAPIPIQSLPPEPAREELSTPALESDDSSESRPS